MVPPITTRYRRHGQSKHPNFLLTTLSKKPQNKYTRFHNNIYGKQEKQSKGLSSVVPFVPFGCSSRSAAEKAFSLRSTDTSQPINNKAAKKKAALFFRLLVPHLHTGTALRSGGYCIHNTASFRSAPQAPLHCIPAVSCLPPPVFSAVAPSPSHRVLAPLSSLSSFYTSIRFQLSIIHYQLSISSVALP